MQVGDPWFDDFVFETPSPRGMACIATLRGSLGTLVAYAGALRDRHTAAFEHFYCAVYDVMDAISALYKCESSCMTDEMPTLDQSDGFLDLLVYTSKLVKFIQGISCKAECRRFHVMHSRALRAAYALRGAMDGFFWVGTPQ